MTVFLSTLNQMAFLMLMIVIGFILVRSRAVPAEGAGLLSKLENNVFIPALVLGTFMQNFTTEYMTTAGGYFLCGLAVTVISIPIAIGFSRLLTKDDYLRKIYTYGLSFANFGFMGNAVVSALFPDIFMNYLIFVLPLWIFIYVWGVPYLLTPSDENGQGLKGALMKLVNPMFIAMVLGMLIGMLGIPRPSFVDATVTTLGNCMSPIAMILTGMTIAKIDIKATLKNISIYTVSLVRLILIPVVAVVVLWLLPIPYGLKLCTVCAVAMPLGLNTIVVPAAYGSDTSVAAGMALVSHLLSCITIPLIFMLFDLLIA